MKALFMNINPNFLHLLQYVWRCQFKIEIYEMWDITKE